MKARVSLSRQGMFLPIVLGVVTILTLLILVLSNSATTTYTLNALVNHHMHAKMIGQAVIEDAMVYLSQELSNPVQNLAPSPLRQELLRNLFQAKEFELELTNKIDPLKHLYGGSDKDPYANPDPGGAQAGVRVVDFDRLELREKYDASIDFIRVRFHSFVPMKFSTLNLYDNPAAYYKDPLQPGGAPPAGDFVGFYTVSTKVRYGKAERTISVSRDFKVINNEPIAKEFVLFAGGNTPVAKQQSELNRPGRLVLKARGKGRVFMQGPYYLDVEGAPDGTNNPEAQGLSYLEPGDWEGLSWVPPPRALSTCSFFSGGYGRPNKTSGMGITFGVGGGGCLSMGGGDPAISALPERQNYWAASVPVGKQYLSLTGDAGERELFRGLIYGTQKPMATPLGYFNGDPEILEEGMEARIEGALIGNFHQINFQKFKTCISMNAIFSSLNNMFGGGTRSDGPTSTSPSSSTPTGVIMEQLGNFLQVCTHFYTTSKGGKNPAYYGLGRYSSSLNKLEVIAGLINDSASILQSSGNANSGNDILGAVGRGFQNMADGAKQSALSQNTLKGGIREGDVMPAPAILPSNYKPFTRTAALKYPSLADYFKSQGRKADSKELYLNGNIWVDEMVMERNLTYLGTGSLISAYVPRSNIFQALADPPRIKGLKAEDPNRDHLNIFYLNAENPEQGAGMLEIDGKMEASIYSLQGVKPAGRTEILGNLVVSWLNKDQFGDGNDLVVTYDEPKFIRNQETNFSRPERWFTISLSPKMSGMIQNLGQRLNGPGDDGVRNIIDSLDNIPQNSGVTPTPPQPLPPVTATPAPSSP